MKSNSCLLAGGPAVGQPNISISLTVDTTTPIPGGTGFFTSFLAANPTGPCISYGNIAFFGADSGGQQGIYAMPSGPPNKVADLLTPIPGGIGNFIAFPTGPCMSGDNVAFVGNGTSGQQGVYFAAVPTGPPLKVADILTPIPGGTGFFTCFPNGPAISGANVVLAGTGAETPSGAQQGVYFAGDAGRAAPQGRRHHHSHPD